MEFKAFAKEYDFKHITSSPRYAQSNGCVEAEVKIAKNIIKKSSDVQLGLLAYKSTPLENGISSAELRFSRKIRSNKPVLPSQLESFHDNKIVQEKEQIRKSKQEEQHNQRHQARELAGVEAGTAVWIIDLRRYGRIVSETEEPNSYIIKTKNGLVRRNRLHVVPAPFWLEDEKEWVMIPTEKENKNMSSMPYTPVPIIPHTPAERREMETPDSLRKSTRNRTA